MGSKECTTGVCWGFFELQDSEVDDNIGLCISRWTACGDAEGYANGDWEGLWTTHSSSNSPTVPVSASVTEVSEDEEDVEIISPEATFRREGQHRALPPEVSGDGRALALHHCECGDSRALASDADELGHGRARRALAHMVIANVATIGLEHLIIALLATVGLKHFNFADVAMIGVQLSTIGLLVTVGLWHVAMVVVMDRWRGWGLWSPVV